MENNRKKILITGAAGLIGNCLANALADEYEVVGIDNNFRPNSNVNSKKFLLIDSDIKSFVSSNINTYDYIFHFSAINGTQHFYNMPDALIENNVVSDLEIFNFARKNKNCKIIYASSSEIVANSDIIPTPELTDVCIKNIHNPRWSYRISKMLSENYLVNSNLNFLIVRFFNIYSENSKNGHFIADILDKIKNKDYVIIGANETRSFCHVDDAVNALLNIFKIANNEVVNIGNDEEITIYQAVEMISQELEINIDWKLEPGLPGSTIRRSPCIAKLKNYYPDYCPMQFKIGIKKVLKT